MNPEDIVALLEKLAEKLTPPAQYVFDLAVRQMIITTTINIIAFSLLLVVAVVTIALVSRFVVRHTNYTENLDDRVLGLGAVLGVGGFWVFVALINLAESIPVILNPEWAVLMQLKDLLP